MLPTIGCPQTGCRTKGQPPSEPPPQKYMTYKKRCELAQCNARRAMRFMPAPRSSRDVVSLLTHAAHLGLANAEMVSHLAVMGALFPKELLGAFRAFQQRRDGDN